MPRDVQPMLFAPPQPPYPLPVGDTVVLGRSRDCDLQLNDVDTSRRHAKIVCERDRFVLHDLASTNGTWVNGARVEERELRPGDRIQIGAHAVTFCQVSGGIEPSDDGAQTQQFERPVPTEVFRGDLAEIPPFAVLQILELGRKSGVLQIESTAGTGRLWLRRGEPIHAETAGQLGFDAALAIVDASVGHFSFEPQLALPQATIEASVTELLLEASRRLDEGEPPTR